MSDLHGKGLYKFGSGFAETYEQRCPECGRINRLSTQRDNEPEYYTEVWIECGLCYTPLRFDLPVN